MEIKKIFFGSSLNGEATVNDILSLTTEEFSAFLTQIKAEYKKEHNIPSKKKACRTFNYVLQKMRKLSKQFKTKMGAYGKAHYMDMDVLMDAVFAEFSDELAERSYTKEKFLMELADEVAPILASGIFHASCRCSANYSVTSIHGQERFLPENLHVATYAIFKGSGKILDPLRDKEVQFNFPKAVCASGIDCLDLQQLTRDFYGFSELDKYLGRCSIVNKLRAQRMGTTCDADEVLTLSEEDIEEITATESAVEDAEVTQNREEVQP